MPAVHQVNTCTIHMYYANTFTLFRFQADYLHWTVFQATWVSGPRKLLGRSHPVVTERKSWTLTKENKYLRPVRRGVSWRLDWVYGGQQRVLHINALVLPYSTSYEGAKFNVFRITSDVLSRISSEHIICVYSEPPKSCRCAFTLFPRV